MKRADEIAGRIDNIRQIESIVTTLRALAVGHQQEARAHLGAIRAHEKIIAGALSTILPVVAPEPGPAAGGRGLSIIAGAAQGFSGAYGDRIAEAALAEAASGQDLMVVGGRTLAALDERGVAPVWSAEMAPHALDVPALANRLADALFDRLARGPGGAVTILFADPAATGLPLSRRTLFPFDFDRFARSSRAAPLLTQRPRTLLAGLVEEYVHAEVCEALMLGFASENAARAAAMTRARSNVRRIASDLKSEFQRARQEEMTTEIVELSVAASING